MASDKSPVAGDGDDRDAEDPTSSLRSRTAKGFAWTFSQAMVVRLLSLVGFAVLGRLLTPSDYGLAALAAIFQTLMYLLATTGLGQALVQREEIDKADLDTVFWIGTGLGTALALLLSALAWPLASLYHEPELRPVLQFLSIGFVLVGVGTTQAASLQRELRFQAIAKATMASNLIATALGVAFAFAGFGVYALVVQSVVAPALTTVFNTLQSGYRPGRQVVLARFWSLFAYSRQILGTSLMGFLNTRTDDLLIGSTLGSTALGVYTVAYRLLTVMIDVLAVTARSVAFPVFSRVQGDIPRLRRAYMSAMRMSAVIAFPIFSFTMVAAPVIIPALFGPQWHRSIPVMQILCGFGIVFTVNQFSSALLQSIGRAQLVFRLSVAGTVLQVLFFVVAVNFGIAWVAASFVIRAYLVAPFYFTPVSRELGITVPRQLGGLVAPAVSSAIMCVIVWGVEQSLRQLPDAVLLIVLLVVGAVSFVGSLRLLSATTYSEALDYVRAALGRAGEQPNADAV